MRIMTERQLTKLKCDVYENGFQNGKNMKKKIDELWFHGVCMYIKANLIELERNTWDKDRVNNLREYINLREQLFGEFTTGEGRNDRKS